MPLHESATVPANPLMGVNVTVYLAVWPPLTVCDAGEPPMAKSPTTCVTAPDVLAA